MPQVDPRNYIVIRGARQHNLAGFDLDLPKRSLVVITGPSGSGKSSLALDTIFAEGQRRYVESLSAYARQFLKRMDKPDVDMILGLSPAIAIKQQTLAKNPRSTVATQTEIYDHLRMLFAQIGKTISPISGEEVTRDSPRSVAEELTAELNDGTRFYVTFEVPNIEKYGAQALEEVRQRGFFRVIGFKRRFDIDVIDLNEADLDATVEDYAELLVLQDRLIMRCGDDAVTSRIADSVEQAFKEGEGWCMVLVLDDEDRSKVDMRWRFSVFFERDGLKFIEPTPNLFSFNSPIGACPECKGFGNIKGPDHSLIIPDVTKSIMDGAIKPFESSIESDSFENLLLAADAVGMDLYLPYCQLPKEHRRIIWQGLGEYTGIVGHFEEMKDNFHRKSFRFHHARYQGLSECLACLGSRLRSDAMNVKVGGKDMGDIVNMTVKDARVFFDDLVMTDYEQAAAGILLEEIRKRLSFLDEVGLAYLTLGRMSQSLSGGESQRIALATSLGSALVGALYVLDEPTIGLHSRDTLRLIGVLKKLRDLGNTVIVVEHDPDVMKHAGHIVDLGPGSGHHGGRVMFTGTLDEMHGNGQGSLTGAYLSGQACIPVPERRREPDWTSCIKLKGASANNLKQVDVQFPLGLFICVTGVSGSGKSSLVEETLVPAVSDRLLLREVDGSLFRAGDLEADSDFLEHLEIPSVESLEWTKLIRGMVMVDQSPVGLSHRSNPASYTKVFSQIRDLLANTPQARMNGYKPGFFSFNVDGGRCDECKGDGSITIDMQFLADLHLPCEACNGTRYGQEALRVEYQGKNVHDILNLTIDQALAFFRDHIGVRNRLQIMSDIGLGYLKMGQPLPTLSGGEAQRVKLAAYMGEQDKDKVFVFDEPTTGLHFDDVRKLIQALNRIVEQGNTVIVIEHNLELIKCADWVIDLGPEGGAEGGRIVAAGPPEQVVDVKESYTGRFLRPLLAPAMRAVA